MKLQTTGAATTVLTLLVAVTAPQDLVAQEAQEDAIEEVVVTAQKRGQSIEDVPLSITALTGEDLRDSLTLDAKDLVLTTPGLSGYGLDSCLCTISIRGISVNNYGIGGDPSVGIFKNGVYSGTTGEALSSFYDIDRVEVLRGPQGLLFGRAAIGGAMHVLTRKPSLDEGVAGSISAGSGERGQLRFDGAVNMPVSDTLGLRLAALHQEEDGWVNNTVPGQPDAGAWSATGIRGSALFEDGPLSVFVMGEYEDREGPGAIYVPIGASLGMPLSGNLYQIESDVDPSLDRDASEGLNFSVEVNYELGNGTLTSLTGIRSHEWFYGENSDTSGIAFLTTESYQDSEYRSQELRYVSSDEGTVRWFVGASWFSSRMEFDGYVVGEEDVFCLLNLEADCASATAAFGLPWSGSADGNFRERTLAENESTGAAFYTDVTVDLGDAARLSVGFRYSREDRDFTVEYPAWPDSLIDDYFGIVYWVAAGRTSAPVMSSESWSNFAPRALIEFDLGADALVYASTTNGFKPGGFNTFGLEGAVGFDEATFVPLYDATSSVASFDEETVWSHEVGVKGKFLDGGGRYALSAYLYDYEDLQILSFGQGGTVVDNVGQAEGLGIEFEVSAALNAYLTADLGLSWANSEIGGMANNLEACAEPDFSNCDGNRLAFHPEFTVSANLRAEVPVGNVQWFGVAEVAHQDNIFSSADNNPQFEADAWTFVNLRVGAYIGEQWQVSAFVENLFEQEHLFYGFDLFFVQTGLDPAVPRTFGFDVRYHF